MTAEKINKQESNCQLYFNCTVQVLNLMYSLIILVLTGQMPYPITTLDLTYILYLTISSKFSVFYILTSQFFSSTKKGISLITLVIRILRLFALKPIESLKFPIPPLKLKK
jgi:hypothetical protein